MVIADDKDVLTYLTSEKIYTGELVVFEIDRVVMYKREHIGKGIKPMGIAIEDSKNGKVRVCHKGLLGFRDCPRPIPRKENNYG